jgi:hypothetical protein
LPIAIPEGLSTNWTVILTRGVSLEGKVLNEAGEPISRARVVAEEQHGGVDVAASSDAQGNFNLEHLPPGPATLQVTAAGYVESSRTVPTESNSAPVIFHLHATDASGEPPQRQPIRLMGQVVDGDSGEPISQFNVLLNERRGTSKVLLGQGHDGSFDWNNSLTYVSEYSLEVHADGYEPQASSVRQRADGDQTFEFRLKKGGQFAGRVLRPDGQAAAGAMIGLQAEGTSLRFMPAAKLVNYGHGANQTTADGDGFFSLNSSIGAKELLVVHETGCAALPVEAKTNLVIQLQTWSSIEGVLYIGRDPAPGQMVDVGFHSSSHSQMLGLNFDLTATTDEQGRFRFDRLPPGTHMVGRLINPHPDKPGPIGFSQGEFVTVKPGETAHVTLGGKGRTVVGQFVLPPSITNYDWPARLVSLVHKQEGPPPPRMSDFPDTQAYYRAWNAYDASIAKHYLEFQADGSFRVNDVLPGEYTLALSINLPPPDPLREDAWLRSGPEIGGITNTIHIPTVSDDNTESLPIDLGTILVPLKTPGQVNTK